jgi:hypothetical protein
MKAAPLWMPNRGAWIFYVIAGAIVLIALTTLIAVRDWRTGITELLFALGLATHPYFRREWFRVGYDVGYDEGVSDALRVNE